MLTTDEARQLEEWLPHVRTVAWSVNVPLPFEEKVQEGVFGAARAIRTYDPSMGASMKTYVGNLVAFAIVDASRRLNGRRPGDMRRRAFEAAHLEDRPGAEVADDTDEVERLCTRLGIEKALDRIPNPLDRSVIERRLSGMSWTEIGAQDGVDPTRGFQRWARGVDRLRQALSEG